LSKKAVLLYNQLLSASGYSNNDITKAIREINKRRNNQRNMVNLDESSKTNIHQQPKNKGRYTKKS
jgi:hypothetical protein